MHRHRIRVCKMTRLLLIALLASLAISGCCTRQQIDDWTRFEQTADKSSGFCGIFSGWGTKNEPERWTAVYSPVGVGEYGELLCGHVEPEEYATCVNRIWAFWREAQREPRRSGQSLAGPFAVVVWDEVFLGSYRSDLFSASFRVSNDRLSCTGSYSALYGKQRPIFDVNCDNGSHGEADIVLDRTGRNGIGRVYMDDGSEGKIVFGHETVGGALETAAR